MQLSRLGYFSGTPLRTGEFVFTVRASNGCGWTGKRFTLVVTGAPIIKATPVNISFACKADETPVPQQIRVSATWPQLRYLLTMSNAAWLTATPEHGATPRHGSGMADDIVHLSVSTIGLKPGRYSATITVSSWQALEPVRVEVELKVN
jgi:hypothetical protein